MNIALVFPKSTFLVDPMVYPPLGLWYLAAQLEAQGHRTWFYDLSVDSLPKDGLFDQIWVSATSAQMAEVRRLGEILVNYHAPAVLGGPAVWCSKEVRINGYTLLVSGEADTPDAVRDITNAAPVGGYLKLPTVTDLNHVLPPIRIWEYMYHATLEGKSCTTMMTSRGCPYACAFCETGRSGKLWGDKVRFEPLPVVLDQIDEIAKSHQAIQFYDDILPIDVQRTQIIADRLQHHGLIWRCFCRSDLTLSRGHSLLKQMRDCGLVEVLVGVESGSNRIKSNIHKGATIEQDTEVLEWCKRLGIKFKASLILGLPGETTDTMEESLKWILKSRPDRVDLNILIPFPNTPITRDTDKYDLYCTSNVPEEYWYKGNQKEQRSLVGTSALTPQQIEEFHRYAITKIQEEGIPY